MPAVPLLPPEMEELSSIEDRGRQAARSMNGLGKETLRCSRPRTFWPAMRAIGEIIDLPPSSVLPFDSAFSRRRQQEGCGPDSDSGTRHGLHADDADEAARHGTRYALVATRHLLRREDSLRPSNNAPALISSPRPCRWRVFRLFSIPPASSRTRNALGALDCCGKQERGDGRGGPGPCA